jgi:N-acetyl-1-D-myo-inositol-2-amino-2-deoxy-alpha-D-glucopyranoside deacetylase
MNKHLLLVHAHPDDESIGQGATMARYVAEGVGVTLVTCTGGEMGEILVPEMEHMAADRDDTLADQRKIELDNAMKALGVTDHRYLGGFKRYRDSGMQWHADGHAVAADDVHENAFWNADLLEAASHLVEIIREVRPQVMVTYDEFGGYGHPDHIQAHRVAMYAASLAAIPSFRRDLGEAWEIDKIYWGAMSESRMRAGLRRLRDAGDTTTFEGMDPDGPLPRFAVSDGDLSAAVDGGTYVENKMAALRAHPTQITVDGPFFALSNNVGESVWATELNRLAKGTKGAEGLDTDLFAGLGGSWGTPAWRCCACWWVRRAGWPRWRCTTSPGAGRSAWPPPSPGPSRCHRPGGAGWPSAWAGRGRCSVSPSRVPRGTTSSAPTCGATACSAPRSCWRSWAWSDWRVGALTRIPGARGLEP